MTPGESGLSPIPAHVPPELVHDFDFVMPPSAGEVQLAWKRLHDTAPDIFWTPRHGGHWIATRGEDIKEIQTNYRRFSQRVMTVPAAAQTFRILPANADPPEHAPYRRIVMPAFAPAAIAALDGSVRVLAAELVDEIAPRGACDFVADFGRKLPIVVFLKIVDLPLEDRAMLLAVVDDTMHSTDPDKRRAANAVMTDYIAKWVAARRAKPGNDLISLVVHGEIDGRPLTTEEIFSLVTLILFGGLDTVTSLMGFIWRFLAMHPGHCRELVAEPALRRNAIEELIRRHGIVSTARVITEDCVYKGVPLKAGDMIQIPNALYGLDERINPDPLTVDFRRERPQHAVFGSGPHTCPGAALARREIAASLDAWLARIPAFALAPDFPPRMISVGTNNAILRLDLVWSSAR